MKIEIKDLSKKYEGSKSFTLKDLNLKIDSKDFCVLLGPSGCGKTTLLRMIAGLNSITSGDLLFNGERVNELAPKDRDIAMVFQSYALYPHMNVYNNIAFGLKIAKEKKDVIDRRVKDVSKLLNIDTKLHNKPADLSGGQRQRVALGRAIARKPSIFLMDEPLSNLDAKLREKMRLELVRIHNMLGTTSIYVTHDQLEAMTMATKIVLMNNQRIVQIGSPEEIYSKPNSIFAAKFIGSPSMNMVEGFVEGNVFTSTDGHITAKISKKHADLIKKFKLREVVLGFRGTDIKVNETSSDDLVMNTKVEIIENLGSNFQLVSDISKEISVTTITQLRNFKTGSKIKLAVSNEDFHFFDTVSTQRVTKKFPALKKAHDIHEEFLAQQESLNVAKKKSLLSRVLPKKKEDKKFD